jgi:hypothetical protein
MPRNILMGMLSNQNMPIADIIHSALVSCPYLMIVFVERNSRSIFGTCLHLTILDRMLLKNVRDFVQQLGIKIEEFIVET